MSELTLESIQKGLSDLRHLGKSEKTFEVAGQRITLRTLGRPGEESVQVKAQKFIDTDTRTMLPWLNAQKYETLSRAIVQINEVDLRGVEALPMDGEKVSKEYFVQDLLNTWDTHVVEACWKKYEDLAEEAKERVFEQMDFLDREDLLRKHEKRVGELRSQLDKPPLVPDEEDESDEKDVDDMDRDELRDMVFDPDRADDLEFEFGEVEEAKRAEAEAASGSRPNPGPSKPGTPADRDMYDSDDPGRELTDEEKRVLEAQEKEFQRRQKRNAEEKTQEEREPMNRKDPQIRRGEDWDRESKPSHIQDGGAPEDDDFVDGGTQFLGPSR